MQWRWARGGLIALGATGALSCGALPAWAQGPAQAQAQAPAPTDSGVPSFAAVRQAHAPSDIPLLSREGVPLQMLRVDAQVRRGPWLALADVSPALRHALVLSEDRRFWDHGGVDWQALAASAWGNAWNQKTRGASTLTMQLAGLLDSELARPAGGRSVGGKVSQMVRARALEAQWSKTQILEAYLNHVPLRGELVGVAAASQQLFGKHASGLDTLEAAVLSAMVRAPNAPPALLQRRACAVLQQQALGCEGLGTAIEQALARRPGPAAGESLAPHLAQQLWRGQRPQAQSVAHTPAQTTQQKNAQPPQALHSTLDATVQRVALAALRRQLAELRGRNAEDGAVLVLDNASGEVLAWVGSAGAGAGAADVDAVLARRQPGSTIKPFVYALALQQRLLTPASLLDDAPLQLASGGALYRPQNYDHRYRGAVTVRTALASSLNVPAVRVAHMLGPDALFDSLNRAGLRIDQSAGFHGLALALGSADVTLLDLSNAYRMLAQQGLHSPVRWRSGTAAPTPQRVLPAAVAWLVADMLADPAARATTFGLDSPLVTRGWAAVKTGTSKDLRDNWCVGFTSRYTVGVWVGNASGAPMHGVSGVSGAAPVWREVVAHLHAPSPSRAPPTPPGLVALQGDWALAGTEAMAATRQAVAQAAPMPRFGIQSPREGSVVVLDPEIPMAAQRLVFEGQAGQWFVNGRPVGSGTAVQWLPRPGRHVLERRSAEGSDRVLFEVRAAPFRRPNG
jgi:penicillin-binding protein 1C